MYDLLGRLFNRLTLAMAGVGLTTVIVMLVIAVIAWIRR